jgi:formylglycine-generating enzyme required for sulfatase activity
MKARILLVSVLVLMMSGLGYCSYPGDCNNDMVVDDFDFNLVITNFGNNYSPVNGPGDCWQDGVVDDFDFNQVITNFGADYRNITPGEMIYIPAGDFQMGNNGEDYGNPDEFPQHSVYLSEYWIGKYEVTRGEYRQFMNAGGYLNSAYWSADGWNWKVAVGRTEPNFWATQQNWSGSEPFTQSDNYPVVGVIYYEAEAYCNWAGGHLPTEAQWEKAARWNPVSSHPNVYPWGDTWDQQRCNNENDSLYPGNQTAPVGSYASGASPYGCMDMAGNVWEWCKDWYDESYYSTSPASDPPGPSSGSYRVLRGGAWYFFFFENLSRAAFRSFYGPPDYADFDFGFRLARD